MIKRDIIETVYEYDNEGKLIKKTVTETHEDDETIFKTYWHNEPYVYCNETNSTDTKITSCDSIVVKSSDN